MANPFEMLAQFQKFKDEAAVLLESTDGAWFLRAATAKLLETVLQMALDAGPPASFAASLQVDEATALVLYSRVLRAAMLRQKDSVTHGRQ